MSETTAMAGSAQSGGDAAALSLIDMRRIDRMTGKSAKPGDLTHLLKHASGAAPSPRMMAAPAVAPIAAPPRPAVAPAPAAPPATRPATDRATGSGIKRGDLTHLLKHASGAAPPIPMTVAPAVAPLAAPPPAAASPKALAPDLPALAAVAPAPAAPPATSARDRAAGNKIKRGDLTHLLKRPSGAAPPAVVSAAPMGTPAAAPPPAAAAPPPAPELPPLAAFAAEPAPPPVTRRAVALPEPYLEPDPALKPTYVVGGFAVLPPLPAPPSRAAENSAPLAYDDVRSVDDLVDYWDRLRGGRELPLLSRLDRTRIAISWPNTFIVGFDADDMPQLTRLSRFTPDVTVTSAVTEWVLSCARRVARLGKAMETDRDFADEPNARQYQLLLLPFAGATGASDHMLCNLRRSG